MGPITLFDKSFLQSLSVDEAVWFDHFFMPVICPIFYVETLADLAKKPSKGRSPELMVRDSAGKFPEMSGSPCEYHRDICMQNLLGFQLPMDGRIPRPGGRPVKSGVVYDPSPAEEAFHRWQKAQFREVEQLAAAAWRKQLSELDLAAIAKELKALGVDRKSCKTLEEARDFAKALVNATNNPYAQLALAVHFLHIPQHLHKSISDSWVRAGRRPLSVFAPYAAHVLTVEMFFQIALAADLIATNRASNRTDIAYLFYLPFCTAFVSSDNLHRRCAHLFMRSDQEFVWGIDLKAALKEVNAHFLRLPEVEREKGVMRFASSPPAGNLVANLWDRHLRKGYRDEPPAERDPQKDAELLRRFKEFRKRPTLEPADVSPDEEPEIISIARSVHRRRGSWYQVPKDMPDPPAQD